MFGFFKNRPSGSSAVELQRLTAAASEDVKSKWVYFNQTIQLKSEVPLSQKIDLFVEPVQQFIQNKYPALLQAPSDVFWLTVFTAILESETHPKEQLNAAIQELRGKYVHA